MQYTLSLTESEESSLRLLRDRGYDPGLYDALQATGRMEDGANVYAIEESAMWKVAESAYFPCAFSTLDWHSSLGVKIQDLLNEIV